MSPQQQVRHPSFYLPSSWVLSKPTVFKHFFPPGTTSTTTTLSLLVENLVLLLLLTQMGIKCLAEGHLDGS